MELTSILNETLTFISSFALKCAVELDVASRIKEYGRPMPLNELALSIPIPPEKAVMLGRVMALLVQRQVFGQIDAGYVLTPVSGLLTGDSNMSAFVRFSTGPEVTKPMSVLSEWLRDAGRNSSFSLAYDGKKFWDVAGENPEIGNLFNEALAGHSKQLMKDFVTKYPNIFDGINNLVDVGGGTGTAVKIISAAFPNLRCTVLDLPHVIANALKDESFNVVAGNMFEKIPSADAILLKNVLHDWRDDDCIRILKRCKEAIEPKKDIGGKVIVVDVILGNENNNPYENETSFLYDLLMMNGHGSHERAKEEWHDIFTRAGYSGYKIYPARLGIDSVMELYP